MVDDRRKAVLNDVDAVVDGLLGAALGVLFGFERLSAADRLMDLAKSQKRCRKSGGYSVP